MASLLEQHGFKFVNYPEGNDFAASLHFSHAVIVPPSVRTVVISGQVGIQTDGTVPSDMLVEVELAFDHVKKALMAAGLSHDALEYVFDVSCAPLPMSGGRMSFRRAGGLQRSPCCSDGLVLFMESNVDEQATFYFARGFDAAPFGSVVKRMFGNTRPATVGLEVANLVHPDLHLEIRVVAFLP